jgi:site-specific recombinase XerD
VKRNTELLDQFESNFRIRGRSEGTVRVYTSHVRTFTNWLEGKSLLEVNEDSLELYINHLLSRNLKAKSMNSIFDALGALFGFFKFKRFLDNNPIPEVRRFYISQYKDEEHRRQVISTIPGPWS